MDMAVYCGFVLDLMFWVLNCDGVGGFLMSPYGLLCV
jgi:hypothetical protein